MFFTEILTDIGDVLRLFRAILESLPPVCYLLITGCFGLFLFIGSAKMYKG